MIIPNMEKMLQTTNHVLFVNSSPQLSVGSPMDITYISYPTGEKNGFSSTSPATGTSLIIKWVETSTQSGSEVHHVCSRLPVLPGAIHQVLGK